MNRQVRLDLLYSLGLVALSLGALETAALRVGREAEMARMEMRLALLRARLQAGSPRPQLLAEMHLFIADFEAFIGLCCRH